MTARPLFLVLLASLLLVPSIAPVAAQSGVGDPAAAACGPFSWPCWVVGALAIMAGLLLLTIVRITMLARRIRRGPQKPHDDDALPPDLRDPSAAASAASAVPAAPAPLRMFPPQHAPWPDERAATPPTPITRRIREPPTQQVVWGDHRLWFADGHYFFSIEDEAGHDDWLPCFSVPKGQRIVAGPDGVPRLERHDPRHP